MIIRHIYLGYFKYPKLIEHFRNIGDEVNVVKWQELMHNCRTKKILHYILLAILCAFFTGAFQLGIYLLQASRGQ